MQKNVPKQPKNTKVSPVSVKIQVPKQKSKKRPSATSDRGISPQTVSWLGAVNDPFNAEKETYVPAYPARPSRKCTAFARGSMATSSTTGVGYLVTTGNICNDQAGGYVTTSANTILATGAVPDSTGTGVSLWSFNSDYASSTFGSGSGYAQQRLVALGIRVRYAGSELNRGGTIYALEHPLHKSLGSNTFANLASFESCYKGPVQSNKWTEVSYHFLDPEDFAYNSAGYPTGWSGVPLAIAIVAPSATTSISFDWEAVVHYEIIGANVRGKSPSFSDIVGVELATNAVQLQRTAASVELATPHTHATEEEKGSWLKSLYDLGASTVSHIDWNRVGRLAYLYTAYRRNADMMRRQPYLLQ